MTDRSKVKTDPGSLYSGLVGGLASKLNELEDAVTQQADRFASVIEIAAEIARTRDLDQLLTSVMDRLATLVGAEAATLFLHDRAQQQLWSKVLKGTALKELRLADSEGIAGYVFQSGESVSAENAYDDDRFNPSVDRQSGFKTRSIIAVPLKHARGRPLGVVEVLHPKVGAFRADDAALIEAVAAQIAAVLDNVLLMDELKRRSDELARRVGELDALYEVERTISGADQTKVVDAILSKTMELLKAKAGSILLVEEERDALFFRHARGDKAEGLLSTWQPTGKGISGHVAASGQVVREFDAQTSEHFDKALAKRLGVSATSVLCVPIPSEGRILGALELLNKKGGFTDNDERLAVLLAGQIGRALVTQRSQAELERRRRLETIGQLLTGVLHDLRGPMTVIAGFSELMATEPSVEARKDMATRILGQLEHLKAMQKETLAFARGERTVLMRKVFLHTFLSDVQQQLAHMLKGTKVELKVIAAYTGAARLDETKLMRALFNLTRNALEAMPDGGKIQVNVEREGEDMIFRVADNGPGIPEEIADKVFESFVTSGKKNGTGLGLAIVRKIAEEHGGTATFKSKPGKGSTFEIRFPAGVPDAD